MKTKPRKIPPVVNWHQEQMAIRKLLGQAIEGLPCRGAHGRRVTAKAAVQQFNTMLRHTMKQAYVHGAEDAERRVKNALEMAAMARLFDAYKQLDLKR